MKRLIIILVCILVFANSGLCQTTPANNIGVDAEKEQSICSQLEAIVTRMISGIDNLEVDSVFINISENKYSGMISGGMLIRDYKKAYALTKNVYTNFKQLDINIIYKDCNILTEYLAFYVIRYDETYLNNNDKEVSSKGAFTYIFERTDDIWEIIHFHQSSFPVENENTAR